MASAPENDRLIQTDIILLLIAAHGGTPAGKLNGITRLEKLAFLTAKETTVNDQTEEPFEFEAYNYGPYSKEVYEAVDVLTQLKLLSESQAFETSGLDDMEESTVVASEYGFGRTGLERRFSLTDSGKRVAEWLAEIHPKEAEQIGSIRARYGRMSLSQLIRYVYARYPEYAQNSVILHDVMQK